MGFIDSPRVPMVRFFNVEDMIWEWIVEIRERMIDLMCFLLDFFCGLNHIFLQSGLMMERV